MQSSPLLEHLIENLRCLPGVGPKSAQRMAYHLLQRNRSGGMNLARALTEAMSKIGHCSQCRDFTEEETCNICNNPRRQNSGLLCVVEMPADIQAIEQTGQFGLDLLQKRLVEESFHEVILAMNPTVEGDATANYIAEICHQHNIKVSRIAHGIPVGGELETVDGTTLTHSFLGRRQID